jgi:hypothetical protein
MQVTNLLRLTEKQFLIIDHFMRQPKAGSSPGINFHLRHTSSRKDHGRMKPFFLSFCIMEQHACR